jgi:hypothetical protein
MKPCHQAPSLKRRVKLCHQALGRGKKERKTRGHQMLSHLESLMKPIHRALRLCCPMKLYQQALGQQPSMEQQPPTPK